VTRVDVLDRVFPDQVPRAAAHTAPISVPRGGKVAFQFAIRSPKATRVAWDISISARSQDAPRACQTRSYALIPVHVEANSAGGNDSRVGKEPPETWWPYLIRRAPFDVAEVLCEATKADVEPGRTAAVVVDVHVPEHAVPGVHSGTVRFRANGSRTDVPFAFCVRRTRVPQTPRLRVVHMLSVEPEDLVTTDPPAWWSKRHWELIDQAASVLWEYGDRSIYTPLLFGTNALIQTIRREDGELAFDFARFDQWAERFLGRGYQTLDGEGVGGGHWLCPPGNVDAVDARTGQKVRIFRAGQSTSRPDKHWGTVRINKEWPVFCADFFRQFHAHLAKRGWTRRYAQRLINEPRRAEDYALMSRLLRRHMPGIPAIGEIHCWRVDPKAISPHVDQWMMTVQLLERRQDLVRQRHKAGRGVGVYSMASPPPPYPNRHLDRPLTDNRLWPILAWRLGADMYDHWAPNRYRGADPYKTSLGPMPSGSQSPGHPPGDNWLFYKGPKGLMPSMRVLAFRAGLIDHDLLSMLGEYDRQEAAEISKRVARSAREYSNEPACYHQAREALLVELDGRLPAD